MKKKTQNSEACSTETVSVVWCEARSTERSESHAPLQPDGTGSRNGCEAHTALRRILSLAGETANAKQAQPKVVLRGSRAKSRGQISAEFAIMLIVLFSLFSLVVFVSFQQKELTDFNSEKIKAKTLMEKTARTVNGIYLSGNGSTTIIEKQFDFELGFEENSVKVYFRQGQFVSASLLAKKIIFISKTNATEISVKNLNGVIEVEEL